MTARAIRDAILERVRALKIGASHSIVVTPTIQPSDLPRVQVLCLQDQMTPDGDSNAGAPSFIIDSTIGVSVIRGFDDPAYMAGQLDADADAIFSATLSDPDFVSFGLGSLFEGVERITRRLEFPKIGEAYFAELRLEMTFRHRCDFEPNVPGDFHSYTATLRGVSTPAGEPVRVDYDLRQD